MLLLKTRLSDQTSLWCQPPFPFSNAYMFTVKDMSVQSVQGSSGEKNMDIFTSSVPLLLVCPPTFVFFIFQPHFSLISCLVNIV